MAVIRAIVGALMLLALLAAPALARVDSLNGTQGGHAQPAQSASDDAITKAVRAQAAELMRRLLAAKSEEEKRAIIREFSTFPQVSTLGLVSPPRRSVFDTLLRHLLILLAAAALVVSPVLATRLLVRLSPRRSPGGGATGALASSRNWPAPGFERGADNFSS